MVQQAQAGPFIAVALLATIVGGSAAGAACSAHHCKRSIAVATINYVSKIGDCVKDVANSGNFPTVTSTGSTFTITGLPQSCIEAQNHWDGVTVNTTVGTDYGVNTIIDQSTISVSAPWYIQPLAKLLI
jgi:hypothetical protein